MDLTWFIPAFFVDETDDLTTLYDEDEEFYIFVVDSFLFSDEAGKKEIVDRLKTKIDAEGG